MAATPASVALAAYALWLVGTWNAKGRPAPFGYKWMVICVQRLFFDVVARCCGLKGYVEFPLAEGSIPAGVIPCVVTSAPHGSFGIGFFLLHFHRLLTEQRFRMFRCYAGGASVLFKVPLLRELLLLLNVREATHRTLDTLISNGNSVALNPGGLYEQVHTTHEQESVILQPKLGFIRLAMKHGVPLLPAYGFGENQMYRSAFYATPTLPLRRWLADRLRIGLPAVYGRFGTIFPFPVHHGFVVGNPVPTGGPNPNPTDEQVNEVLERWKEEMHRIFDSHKHLLPPDVAARGLSISVRRSARSRL